MILFDMLEKELAARIRAYRLWSDVKVLRAEQTTQQGEPDTVPFVTLTLQSTHFYGTAGIRYVPDGDPGVWEKTPDGTMVRRGGVGTITERTEQIVERQIQFRATVPYDTRTGRRPSDLLGLVHAIMRLPSWRRTLLDTYKVQMYRVPDMAPTCTINDSGQFQATEMLMVTFVYTEKLDDKSPLATMLGGEIRRVD